MQQLVQRVSDLTLVPVIAKGVRAALLGGILVAVTASAFVQPAADAQPAAVTDPAPASEIPRMVVTPACDPREAEELRTHLAQEARRASRWNSAWKWTFTAAAVGSTAVALVDPFPELRDGLFVSGGKAAIGALGRWILPLKVDVPEADPDACMDIARLRKALAKAAKQERALFITNHVGGLAVNLAGAGIIWYRGSLGQALLSVATGYPVGLLSTYTMPRGSWKRYRERMWTAAVVPHEHGWTVTIGGAF
jgi:hypothetical protein